MENLKNDEAEKGKLMHPESPQDLMLPLISRPDIISGKDRTKAITLLWKETNLF